MGMWKKAVKVGTAGRSVGPPIIVGPPPGRSTEREWFRSGRRAIHRHVITGSEADTPLVYLSCRSVGGVSTRKRGISKNGAERLRNGKESCQTGRAAIDGRGRFPEPQKGEWKKSKFSFVEAKAIDTRSKVIRPAKKRDVEG